MAYAWHGPAIAALIGAFGGSVVAPLAKDILSQAFNTWWSKSVKQEEIFRNYAAPLTASSEKLLWRFSEIFLEKRHQFLKASTLPFVYNQYKRTSTLYRIASVLGWIRAMHLEMSSLPRGASGFSAPISSAIAKIQCALADGPHVEIHRLEQVCSVWGLSLAAISKEAKGSLATKFEIRLYQLAGDTLKHDSDHLKKVAPDIKLDVCDKLARYLCDALNRTPVSNEVIVETVNRAIESLSYREALVYRDWQDAISDLMLEPDPASVRKFKIIGFEKFEAVLKSDSLWMDVFRDLIVDIDFEKIDPNDFRAKQLKDLSSAVANLLLSLSGSKDGDLVEESVRNVAQNLQMQIEKS
jgi:hypothetical protein